MASNGTFTYQPPVGFEGPDGFTYELNDPVGQTATGNVALTVNEMIWYVDNTAGGGGTGQSHRPFNSLTLLNGAAPDDPGDILFVYSGSGDTTGGIVLENNQQLIGQGVELEVNTHTLVVAGTRPTLSNAGGDGIILAQNNTIRGLNIGNTAGTGIRGNNVGTASVSGVSISGAGAGVNVGTGTLAMSFDSLSSSKAAGITLSGVYGASR